MHLALSQIRICFFFRVLHSPKLAAEIKPETRVPPYLHTRARAALFVFRKKRVASPYLALKFSRARRGERSIVRYKKKRRHSSATSGGSINEINSVMSAFKGRNRRVEFPSLSRRRFVSAGVFKFSARRTKKLVRSDIRERNRRE